MPNKRKYINNYDVLHSIRVPVTKLKQFPKPHETNMAEEESTFETSPLMIRLEQGVNKVYTDLLNLQRNRS